MKLSPVPVSRDAPTAGVPSPAVSDRPRSSAVRSGFRALVEHRALILASVALCAIAVGGILHATGLPAVGDDVWRATVALLATELFTEVVHTIVTDHHMGVDTIALIAMVGSLALGQELAGAVVGLMFSSGQALEDLASSRARRELTALAQRAPKFARRKLGERIERVAIDQVQAGDTIIVRTGEVVPVDGTLQTAEAVIDTSTLTGEPLPVTLAGGVHVLSGTTNAGAPFEVTADRPASESAYAALVRLVQQAQAHRAPFVRTADRYAGFFLPATLVIAGAAWLLSGDPVRALAVVVVATPCPLILAAPIAFVSGMSRAARSGVIVKGASAVETLGRARSVLFDKTGTLTVGTPTVRDVIVCDHVRPDEILRLAASVDQVSAHVLGDALARAATESDLPLTTPTHVREAPGEGIEGLVDDQRVAVGSRAFLQSAGVADTTGAATAALSGRGSGEAHVLIGVDGRLVGVIAMADEPRPEAAAAIGRLRAEGIRYIALVSGDRSSVAERVGRQLGIDRVYGEQSPEQKLEIVRALRDRAALGPVIMVGDGVNDAPALALADLGIAMGAAGATVSSETADAVVTVDRIDRVADAVHAGRRALLIARQSVLAGMGLSFAAMGVAATGHLPPLAGAVLQEAIDLAVILNALRARSG
jgi:heavy metal translocating P-type ATPase